MFPQALTNVATLLAGRLVIHFGFSPLFEENGHYKKRPRLFTERDAYRNLYRLSTAVPSY